MTFKLVSGLGDQGESSGQDEHLNIRRFNDGNCLIYENH